MNKLSERRLKENEVIFRAANKIIKNTAEASSTRADTQNLAFYCECSRLSCSERIELTGKQYEEIHSNKHIFMVLQGHEIPEVEQVIESTGKYVVVKKHGDIPKLAEINLKLKPQEI